MAVRAAEEEMTMATVMAVLPRASGRVGQLIFWDSSAAPENRFWKREGTSGRGSASLGEGWNVLREERLWMRCSNESELAVSGSAGSLESSGEGCCCDAGRRRLVRARLQAVRLVEMPMAAGAPRARMAQNG